jgi:hypothetical protein
MQLLTPELRAQLPPLYSQEDKGPEAIAYVKFFIPYSNWTWYISEFDGDDTFFGLVQGLEEELGYISFSELSSFRGPRGLRVERDLHFVLTPISQLKHNS